MANAIRVLLILASLLAVSTAAVWAFVPRLVTTLDEGLHRHWTARARTDLNSVDDLVNAGKLDRAVETLDGLIEHLDGTQPGDLLDESYRLALQGRVRLLVQLERHEDAVAAARVAVDYDEKDLDNRLRLGTLLLEREATAQEGEEVLAQLFTIVPEWAPAAAAYTDHLVSAGRDFEAVDVALRFARRARSTQMHDWALRWDDGNQFDEVRTHRSALGYDAATDQFLLQVTLPEGTPQVTGVRVDPPLFARLLLREWSVTLRADGDELVIDESRFVDEAGGMKRRRDGSLETRWVDHPNLMIRLPEAATIEPGTVLEFRARLDTLLPPALNRVVKHPKRLAKVEQWLTDNGRDADLEVLHLQRGVAR